MVLCARTLMNKCLELTVQVPLDLVSFVSCFLVKATVISHLTESTHPVVWDQLL